MSGAGGGSKRTHSDTGLAPEGSNPKRRRLPLLGDVKCLLELGRGCDDYRPLPRSTTLRELVDAALPSCPWSYPLRSLYETLGLAGEGAQGVQMLADFGGAAYRITDDDDWLSMLHEIWAHETTELETPVLSLTVTCTAADNGEPEERFDAPREGQWFIQGATRADDDWESCCRFMRHPTDHVGKGQGKVLLGTRDRLSSEEMLDVHRYLRGTTDGGMNGMVYSCDGGPSAVRVQLGIMACIRLCISSLQRLPARERDAGPGADCPHGHPLGIECPCRIESLAWKVAHRNMCRPMGVVSEKPGLATLAAAADRFFLRQMPTGPDPYATPVFAAVDGTRLRDATTGQDLGEVPLVKHQSELPTAVARYRDHIVVLMTPPEALRWLVGEADSGGRPRRQASILLIGHLYIHDWTPTPYFRPELLLGAMMWRDMLLRRNGRMSFSITTPASAAHTEAVIRPLAELCFPAGEAARLREPVQGLAAPPWLVRQGITYRKARQHELGWAPVRASERAVGRISELGDFPDQRLRWLASNVRDLVAKRPTWGLDAVVEQHMIRRGFSVEVLRATGLLPPIQVLWHTAWQHAWNETPSVGGPQTATASPPPFAARVGELECCHLQALAALIRELRGKKEGPGHMVLLVPEVVVAAVLTIWINERMADECIAVWTGTEPGGPSQRMLDVVSQLAEAEEGQSKRNRRKGKTTVLVASTGSIDGYKHSLGRVDWVVCFGEPWRVSEVNGVMSTICDGAETVKELEVIWLTLGSDDIGKYLARMRRTLVNT